MEEVCSELRAKGLNPRLRFTSKGTALTIQAQIPFPRVLEELERNAEIVERGVATKALLDGIVEITVENGTVVFISKKILPEETRKKAVSLAIAIAQVI